MKENTKLGKIFIFNKIVLDLKNNAKNLNNKYM